MNELILPSRRKFIGGMFGLVAAPAIVKAEWIMPISVESKARVTLAMLAKITTRMWIKFQKEQMLRENHLLFHVPASTRF